MCIHVKKDIIPTSKTHQSSRIIIDDTKSLRWPKTTSINDAQTRMKSSRCTQTLLTLYHKPYYCCICNQFCDLGYFWSFFVTVFVRKSRGNGVHMKVSVLSDEKLVNPQRYCL